MKISRAVVIGRQFIPFYVVLSLTTLYVICRYDELLEDYFHEKSLELNVRLYPNNPEALMKRAEFLDIRNRHEEQCRVLEKYHTLHPGTNASLELLGDGYFGASEYGKARKCYEAAVRAAKQEHITVRPRLREQLQTCYTLLGNYPK